ncbi:MAG: hypothetical protein K1X94_31265 [Sandaracinaceae bacterium]|nr:hypothetical protein [Sandaracinaceae bacterium]
MSRVNARLDAAVSLKLDEIRRRTGQSTTAVLVTAIEQYHQHLVSSDVGAHGIFAEAGFLGCAEGPRDLAENAKQYLDFESGKAAQDAEPTYGAVPRAKRQRRR